MGFLFPFFLVAGLALLIPVLIHLFNLRRYKHVLFPNIRFLRQLQVASKRAAKLQKKWLLFARLLFLAALVMAFARPYFLSGNEGKNVPVINLIYLDNSFSMTAKKGPESLLQNAKEEAGQLIGSAGADARFLVLSNDKMSATRPLAPAEALEMINKVAPSAKAVDLNRILGSLSTAQGNEPNERWQVYLFSDFQKSTFLPRQKWAEQFTQTEFYLFPFQSKDLSNRYIDTAYFLDAAERGGQGSRLVVTVKESGQTAKNKSSSLQVNIEGRTRAVRKIESFQNATWTDTLELQLHPGWEKISLCLNDFPLTFDDTFRLTTQTRPTLSVLVLGTNGINPYLQSAFSSYKGFQVKWQDISVTSPEHWEQYSLVILQDADLIPDAVKQAVRQRLAAGGSVLLFPGTSADKSSLNAALEAWGNIQFGSLDTSRQQVVTLQENQDILKGIFEKIPQNIQLPVATKRFPIRSGLTANQQAVMSFRDGSPFLAQFSPDKGRLFLVASPLDAHSSNFALSYFFVPVLYRMAIQNQSSNPPSITIDSGYPVWVSAAGSRNGRSVWHLTAPSFDAVPPQNPSGTGTNIFAGKTVRQPGFFLLRQEEGTDSVIVAINADPKESLLEYASQKDIMASVQPYKVHWLNENEVLHHGWNSSAQSFPLWKICILLALLALALETGLLLAKQKYTRKERG